MINEKLEKLNQEIAPVDTLGVRGYGERHDGKRKQKQQLPVVAGWGLLMYAAVSCFC